MKKLIFFLIFISIFALASNAQSVSIVDLGLSVKWTDRNVGAKDKYDPGYFVSWGELREKSVYSLSTYKYCEGDIHRITKYCSNRKWGYLFFKDDKSILEPEDDIASVELGLGYRIPSEKDWEELIEKCSRRSGTYNGITGQWFTGPNGNSIFIPCVGCIVGEERVREGAGFYWTRETANTGAKIGLINNLGYVTSSNRYDGLNVRAVYIR